MKKIIENLLDIIEIDEKIFKINKEIPHYQDKNFKTYDETGHYNIQCMNAITDRTQKISELAHKRGILKRQIRKELKSYS
jgi:DNA-binding phage protein